MDSIVSDLKIINFLLNPVCRQWLNRLITHQINCFYYNCVGKLVWIILQQLGWLQVWSWKIHLHLNIHLSFYKIQYANNDLLCWVQWDSNWNEDIIQKSIFYHQVTLTSAWQKLNVWKEICIMVNASTRWWPRVIRTNLPIIH